jgi:hypothetical protein
MRIDRCFLTMALALVLTAELPLVVHAAPDVVPALVLPSPSPTPTGKPVKLTKETGGTSPQLLNAHVTVMPSATPVPTSKPLTLTKESGGTTPQLLNAHVTATPSPSPSPHS